MGRASLSRWIRANWTDIVLTSRCDERIIGMLPAGDLRILGSSLKTEAGEELAEPVLTGVAYLAPASSSGRNVCPASTAACRATCLGEHAGRMRFDAGVKRAQLWKTALRYGDSWAFEELVRLDVEALRKQAARKGMRAAVRLDGTSDLGDAERFAKLFPDVVFYDYTKSSARAWRAMHARANGETPNRFVTLSYAGPVNRAACIEYLRAGGTVAVPMAHRKGETFPTTWEGFPTVNGDAHDYRAGDPAGHVVALSWKGGKRTLGIAKGLGWVD